MKRRQWAILGGAAILVLAFLFKNYLASSAEAKTSVNRSQQKLVTYQNLYADSVSIRIPIDGPAQALNKIELFSEVSGLVGTQSQKFEEGASYKKGEVLLALENSEALSAYRSARSNFISLVGQVLPDLKLDYPDRYDTYYRYLQKLSAADNLPKPPTESDQKLKLFLSGRGFNSAYQSAEASRIRLDKFMLLAPFDGTVTEALVESGQLVRAGQALGEYIGEGEFEMLSSLGPDQARMVEIGDTVALESIDGRRKYQGLVYRKNEKVDRSTQGLNVYIRLNASDLNDGEYLRAELRGKAIANAMEISRKLLIDEKHLYVIEDSSLVKLEVDILQRNPEIVIIEAPKKMLQVPVKKITGAYPGMKVKLTKVPEE
ncbi:MAG: HlyD family efflux transporter periplasmic adaptor subunit [Bacteroidetes bacterium]|nr:HlyD family efflux transporter periplasmic adaptor subunit [Bacteroidota bacterium]